MYVLWGYQMSDDIKKLLDEARDAEALKYCNISVGSTYESRAWQAGFDANKEIILGLCEVLDFYAGHRHALFTEEQKQDAGLIRTRVDSVIETGWRAREALAKVEARLRGMK